MMIQIIRFSLFSHTQVQTLGSGIQLTPEDVAVVMDPLATEGCGVVDLNMFTKLIG